MSEAQRQRHERNRREQVRAQRLCLQIEALRDLLVASHIYCSPNKYAILSHVVQYIAQLQRGALAIDAEQQRLQATIQSTTEFLQGGGGLMTHADSTSLSSHDSGDDDDNDSDDDDDESTAMTLQPESYSLCADEIAASEVVQYQDVVGSCPFPIGLVLLDGHIVTSNGEFERLFNIQQHPHEALSLAKQSLFAHVRNHGEVFHAMEHLLKEAASSKLVSFDTESAHQSRPTTTRQLLYWNGSLQTMRNETVSKTWTALCVRFATAIRLGSHRAFSLPSFFFIVALGLCSHDAHQQESCRCRRLQQQQQQQQQQYPRLLLHSGSLNCSLSVLFGHLSTVPSTGIFSSWKDIRLG
jgi:Helix-loop-helix DNA-binding domain